jgi:N-acetylmuramic acid 6-phosphate etherase
LNDLDELTTEAGGTSDVDYELRPTVELVEAMNAEDATVAEAVGAAGAEIAAAIDAIVERLSSGGRLVYVGGGTSGGLAALDAEECVATFSTPPGQVIALTADTASQEDDFGAGAAAISSAGISANDAVVGVSASGRTPYVLGALQAAAEAGALTVALACVQDSELGGLAEHMIAVIVGPEFIAGSTRLKAGTAQKLVLNTLSTLAMVRLGKTYGNLMVDVAATNDKLRARVRRIVETATGADTVEADRALEDADGEAKVAIVALLANVSAAEARRRLTTSEGSIRRAVDR